MTWSLCLSHVRDEALLGRLAHTPSGSACDVCGSATQLTADGQALVEIFRETISFYYDPAFEVLNWDDGEYVGPQSDTMEVVADVGSAAFEMDYSDEILDRVAEQIGDESWTDLSSDGSTDAVEYAWTTFAEHVKHRSRFFVAESTSNGRALSEPFLNRVRAYAQVAMGLVDVVEPGSPFYRGRLVEHPQTLNPSSVDLGPAPAARAAANRMSPAGISMFYASADAETAVAEIAGHGVEPLAVVGTFRNRRQLKVLDFTRPVTNPSPFDLHRRNISVMGRFVRSFVDHVTAPVIPDERQHVEYVPTQVLTEYFRWANKDLDGLVLPSSQTGRRTYVMFFDQSLFVTTGQDQPRKRFSLTLEDIDSPVFELHPDEVEIFEVIRSYSAKPSRLSKTRKRGS